MNNLVLLSNRSQEQVQRIVESHPRQPNMQARVVAPLMSHLRMKEEILSNQDYRGVIIVRHPFDRYLATEIRNTSVILVTTDWCLPSGTSLRGASS